MAASINAFRDFPVAIWHEQMLFSILAVRSTPIGRDNVFVAEMQYFLVTIRIKVNKNFHRIWILC